MSEFFQVDEAGRADKIVAARFPRVGRRRLAELFARGAVRVNGRVARKGDKLARGAEITLSETPEADFAPAPGPELELEVLHADDEIVMVNKPAGMPSHPLRPHEHRTLANALVARFPDCATASTDASTETSTDGAAGTHRREAGLVHRLDTGTSGVIMAARTPRAWRAMRAAFGRGEVEKRYLALVQSADIADGECSAPLVHRGKRMIAMPDQDADTALPATTRWRVIARFTGGYALLECTARTGRMHQVRVHLAHAGAPIVGDALYRGPAWPRPMESGHFLHASALGFSHPLTGVPVRIEAPLPADRQALLDALA